MMYFKNILLSLVPLALILFFSPFILLFTFVTSVIWAPFLLWLSSVLIVTYFVSQKTPIGNRLKEHYLQKINDQVKRSGGPRHFIVENVNHILCLLFPKLQRKATNYGYAVLNQDGKLITEIPVEFEDETFPLQLYHYLATSFEKYKNLANWNVLELECQRGGGMDYIAKHLKARKCIGVTSSKSKFKFCQRNFNNEKLLFIGEEMDKVLENETLQNQQFDLILSVESRSRFGAEAFRGILKTAEKLLNSGGVFMCADFGTMPEMARMAQELEASSLRVVKKEDLSVNILHGFKLEKKRKLNLLNISIFGWVRSLLWKLRFRQRAKLENSLQSGEGIYLAFLLRKD